MTAVLRAHAAVNAAGLAGAGRLVRAPNTRNEVWFIGPFVLRINPVADQLRLLHEHRVLTALGPHVPVAEFVGYGQAAFGEWLVVRRVPGEQLSRTWSGLDEGRRELAITALGQVLQRFHNVDWEALALSELPYGDGDSLDCPHQLPADRLLDLLARASQLRHVDTGVIRGAVELVMASADALDDRPTALIHGDLHFENVLWDRVRLTALVDFEWTRPGPPDLDLDVLLHSLADPRMHVGADYASAVHRRDFEHVTSWLRAAYPALFSHPRLTERLTIYRLSYDTRALLQDPPNGRPNQLSPSHPYRRIQRLVEGRSDLVWTLSH